MEDFYYAGGLPAVLKQLAVGLTADRRAHGQRQHARREHRRRRRSTTTTSSAARQSAGRVRQPRRAARQPRARTAPSSSRPPPSRSCIKHTRQARSCSTTTTTWPRASTIRTSTSTRIRVIVLQHAGPDRRAGHAGMGPVADPEEAAASRACATWCGSPTRA